MGLGRGEANQQNRARQPIGERIGGGCPIRDVMRNTASAPPPQMPGPRNTAHRLPTAWLEPQEPLRVTTSQTVGFDERAYVYQSAWLARALATSRPAQHVDISASACFAAIVSAFLPVDFYEFAPLGLNLPNLRTGVLHFDPLPFRDSSLSSVSTAGIIEWLGCDVPGSREDQAALGELARVVCPDGSLLVSLPVGRPRAGSESHRVYTFGQVLDVFPRFELEEFCLISEALAGGKPLMNPEPAVADRQEHGIGCFWLRKIV